MTSTSAKRFRIPGDCSSGCEGRNESIALRGLHDQPVTTGYMLETPTQPSKKCEDWMRGGYSISGLRESMGAIRRHALG